MSPACVCCFIVSCVGVFGRLLEAKISNCRTTYYGAFLNNFQTSVRTFVIMAYQGEVVCY